MNNRGLIFACVALMVLSLLNGKAFADDAEPPKASPRPLTAKELFVKVSPAVVLILVYGDDQRPFRHAAITQAVKLAQANGYGLEEVLDFSRHANVKTLLVYRDRERNVQGKLAELISAGT